MGMKCCEIKEKLSPRLLRAFEIIERIGQVSYRLALPPLLSYILSIFLVSFLTGYRYHLLPLVYYSFDLDSV